MTAAELQRVLDEELPTGRFGDAPRSAQPVTGAEAAQHLADLKAAIYRRGGKSGGVRR